jgi:hypothetical protein
MKVMRLIAFALALTSVAPADAAGRTHRRRHAGKSMRPALRRGDRRASSQGPLGAPGDGHQLLVERGKLLLDGRPAPRTPERGVASALPLSWSAQGMLGQARLSPGDDRRGALGTELPPPIVLARW